ncbi:hypothetical protein Q4602_17800 [Paraglaciecola chathamensis]|uniref:hypothetical protein n=1 Tax=Paraglaciecola chathamensis TaxID=368405 RepID=UPI002706E929|nr:hypothetical protein [Paraglaciecola chathamensis]MDO6841343.1 hypothetical protein [Paraglaciecola chathamensis]
MKSWKIVFLPLFLIIMSCSEPEQNSGPKIQPVDYIVKESLGSNLSNFARKVARNTQTYKIIESKLGVTETNKIVDAELTLTIKKYQDEWNQNLAKAHSEVLSTEEINSLYYNGKRSPYFEKRMKLQRDIGKSMQSKSKALLTKVVSEAMQKAFKQVAA